MPRKAADPAIRFKKFFERKDDNACWEWQGATNGNYGTFNAGPSRVRVYAHRFAYELAHGPISDRIFVCHRCDNRLCVNPAHLFLGTPLDNMRDMYRKGRQRHLRGEECGHAKLTEEQVIEIRRSDESSYEAAKRYGVNPPAIRKIRQRLRWAHLA